ncbi:MAG: hypothetical protein FWD21_00045 [Peptococcaceae bacterium]|nr:hypothetical protein [Peptococcaceae bacterium]
MRKLKAYLETTLFNYYFDEDRDAHADTVSFFEECASGKFEAYTSGYVINELDNAPIEKRDKMLSLIDNYNITVLSIIDESDKLALRYIAEGAFPPNSLIDASHVASASVNALDMIVSLNFRHIVKKKTIQMTGAVNMLLGYKAVEIYSPMEVVDDEKTRYHIGRGSYNPS